MQVRRCCADYDDDASSFGDSSRHISSNSVQQRYLQVTSAPGAEPFFGFEPCSDRPAERAQLQLGCTASK